MLLNRIGRRGQTILPGEVRRSINLQEGDRIAFVIDGGQVLIKRTSPEFHRFSHAPRSTNFWIAPPCP